MTPRLLGLVLARFTLSGDDARKKQLYDQHKMKIIDDIGVDIVGFRELIDLCFDPQMDSSMITAFALAMLTYSSMVTYYCKSLMIRQCLEFLKRLNISYSLRCCQKNSLITEKS